MGIKTYNPYTPSRRQMSGYDFKEITTSTPEKSLTVSLKKNAGRNAQGKITVRHHGENTESLILKEIKMVFRQLLRPSSMIQTVQLTLHWFAMQMVRRDIFLRRLV